MDQVQLRLLEDQCIQEHAPACTSACPVRVDGRGLCAEISKGDFTSALKLYRKTVPFPGIISRICDQPCQKACVRKDAGGPIELAALEKACVELGEIDEKVSVLPSRGKRVAIVGSGLSGLTVAYDLARKGYLVTLFEKNSRLGGSLWNLPRDLLPAEIIDQDLRVLEQIGVEIKTHIFVQQINAGEGQPFEVLGQVFQAVYLGTGGETADAFALETNGKRKISIDPVTCQTHRAGIFSGGGAIFHDQVSIGTPPTLFNRSPIIAILDGHRAATSIDRYLQKVSLTASRILEGSYQTRLFASLVGIPAETPVQIKDHGSGYSQQQAVFEAERCIQCQCLECVKVCKYLDHYQGYPKRYLREIYNNLSIVKGERKKNQFINSCALCGLCKEICPENLDMGQVCLDARREMVAQKRMPASAHDFALRDMQFSNGEHASLIRPAPGGMPTQAVFFPGCQLSASSPETVEKVYERLIQLFDRRDQGGIGLALHCCGAPAEWAGRSDLFEAARASFLEEYTRLGSPELILACSSCYRQFSKSYPEVRISSLWTFLDESTPENPAGLSLDARRVAIHDPCSTRYERDIQDHARSLIRKLGYNVEELPLNREKTECCGYGGLVWLANRPLAEQIARRRVEESPLDYVTYCAMCRDFYSRQGKPTFHLLDLMFYPDRPLQSSLYAGPDYSTRHENRTRLKRKLLSSYWSEEMAPNPKDMIQLILSEEIRALMEDRHILAEDIQDVIGQAESSGKRLFNQETGHYLASASPASVTYWVEYSPRGPAFEVHNAYSHRMVITRQAPS